MTLAQAKIGSTVTVEKLHLTAALEQRLSILGLIEHTPLKVITKKGDGIMVIMVRGTRLALGANITKGIEVNA